MLLFGNFKEGSEEGWLHVKLQNPILSLISQLPFSIGDENKPSGLRGEDGCLGLSVLWGCKVSHGSTVRDEEKRLAWMQVWVQRKLAVFLIQAPSSVQSPSD